MNLPEIVAKAANGTSGNNRLLALLCPDAPIDALLKAQRSNDWRERAAIALHPNTSERILGYLADEEHAVVRALARHALQIRCGRSAG